MSVSTAIVHKFTLSEITMKTKITKNERLQLIGLLTLAAFHMKAVEDIEKAALEITGEEDDCGHTVDALFDPSRRDADQLLERLNIKVK